jgi:hypothetical protein
MTPDKKTKRVTTFIDPDKRMMGMYMVSNHHLFQALFD